MMIKSGDSAMARCDGLDPVPRLADDLEVAPTGRTDRPAARAPSVNRRRSIREWRHSGWSLSSEELAHGVQQRILLEARLARYASAPTRDRANRCSADSSAVTRMTGSSRKRHRCANRFGELEAIHARHLHVAQYLGRRRQPAEGASRRRRRRLSRPRSRAASSTLASNVRVVNRIIDDEHPLARRARRPTARRSTVESPDSPSAVDITAAVTLSNERHRAAGEHHSCRSREALPSAHARLTGRTTTSGFLEQLVPPRKRDALVGDAHGRRDKRDPPERDRRAAVP
jgi:hypothetical protein